MGRDSIEDVVTTLVNEVSVRAGDLTLVLDDYHLADSTEVAASVSLLLMHLPSQLRLIISTRADPTLPLPRLRARGELVELRAADLRFTVEEAGSYLNRIHDLGLSGSDVEALESRTEGWVAALQLAALSLRGRDDAAAFIASFAGDDRYVVDYLVDEVLDQQPADLRRFLLDTSVLDRLCGQLCDAVTGGAASSAVLEMLERRNLLLIPLDDHRRWYRYHHLFADVLQARLLAERPHDAPVLHGQASDWYQQAGEPEAAVRHAFAAGDIERAADLIEIATPDLRRQRADGTLRSWVAQVPPEVVARRPVLASNLIGALMASHVFDGVADRVDDLERTLSAPPETLVIRDRAEWERLPAQVATHRAGLALITGDLDATIAHADTALSRAAPGDQLTVASASALKGLASWSSGDLASAHEAYVAATQGLATAGHISDALACTVTVVDIELQRGHLDAAHRAAQHALNLAGGMSSGGEHEVVRGVADMWTALGRVAWERGDTDATAEHLGRAGDLGEAAGLPQQPYRWRVAMAKLREAHGDLGAADALLAEAERLFNSDYSPNVRPVPAVRARLHIRAGDLTAARRWVGIAGVAADDALSYLREFEHVTLARLLLAEHTVTGDQACLEQATELLQRLHDAATLGARSATLVETRLLLALACDQAGRAGDGLDWLQQAVAVAEPQVWLRPFLDEGPRISELLTLLPDDAARFGRAVRAAAGPASAQARVLQAAELHPPTDVAAASVVRLSGRELDVLRLLGSDLDGPAIARHLNVSLPTVRTHTQHIYAKLGVNDRRAAVRRAHQLNL
jgi:LuxR family maltose regulon positive regulatory protein